MVVKVRNLNDWTKWQAGKSLPLPKDKVRTVRIEFIANAPTELRVLTEEQYVAEEAGQLLGVIPHGGYECFEFAAGGNILVSATTDGELLFYCSENDQYWVEFEDEVSFTKPFERPQVDPAFQHMRLVMMQNMQAMEERLQRAVQVRREPEPPKAATIAQKEAKPDAGDDSVPDGEDTEPPDGETSGNGAAKPKKAPSAGGAVQSSAAGKGG